MKRELNLLSSFDEDIEHNIELQKEDFNQNILKNINLKTALLDATRRAGALNLRSYLKDTIKTELNLYGIPILYLQTSPFVLNRDFMSCIAVCMAINDRTDYKLVLANLSSIKALKALQKAFRPVKGEFFENPLNYNSCYIETDKSVFYPILNIIIDKKSFYDMTRPKACETITKEDLNKNKYFKKLLEFSTTRNNSQVTYDFTHVLHNIDKLFEGEEKPLKLDENSSKAQQIDNSLDRIFYYAIICDKTLLSKVYYKLAIIRNSKTSNNALEYDNFSFIYNLILS